MDYYDFDGKTATPCSHTSCHNNGQCRLRVVVQPYCKCPPGWTGTYCAEDQVDIKKVTTYVEDVLATFKSIMNPTIYTGISNDYLGRIENVSRACFENTCNITEDTLCRHCEGCANKQYRTLDGRCNDPRNILAGGVDYPLDRSVSLAYAVPETDTLHIPSARLVSQQLLRRDKVKLSPYENQLLTFFIQLLLHDFVDHGFNKSDIMSIPIPETDPVFPEQTTIRAKKTTYSSYPLDPSVPQDYVEFDNKNTAWWDASYIYGFSPGVQAQLRTFENGKLILDDDDRLFIDDKTMIPLIGRQGGFSVGLYLMHTLFAKEHNAICDMLRRNHADWSDEKLFQVSRLILSALSVKVTLTEAFQAFYPNDPVLRLLSKVIPFGGTLDDLVGEELAKEVKKYRPDVEQQFQPVFGKSAIKRPQNFSVAFSLDALSFFRLHSGCPDLMVVKSHLNGALTGKNFTLQDIQDKVIEIKKGHTDADLFYTLGTQRQGLSGLHNTPESFINMPVGQGNITDLDAVGILRDRERGLPRYNNFLRAYGLPPKTSFLNLTHGDEELAKEVAKVYNGCLECVDQTVGRMIESEKKDDSSMDPFMKDIVSRFLRLVYSDRFYTVDYDEAYYTKEGLGWIKRNNMKSILLRHYPELTNSLDVVENVFMPWDRPDLQSIILA
ncbi:uncharacterized protein LOC135484851 [Lineus longissimus]|uniref:uncharacterized protein LOC135484851 n=1 Tax=Lineus longissimus TaxID=88925 RepID=UPI00315DFE91